MSPELLDPETQDRRQTKHSDCYALGMVMYEVLSGQIPFYQHMHLVIPWKVVGGDRPQRPQGAEGVWFMDDVWGVLERCWAPQPGDRPSIEGVLQCLEKISESWTPPSPPLASPPTSSSLAWDFSDTTTRPNVGPTVGSNGGLVIDSTHSKSVAVTRNIPHVWFPQHPLAPALTPALLLGCSTFSMEEL